MKIESTWDFNVGSTSDSDVESTSESEVESTWNPRLMLTLGSPTSTYEISVMGFYSDTHIRPVAMGGGGDGVGRHLLTTTCCVRKRENPLLFGLLALLTSVTLTTS